MSATIRMNGDHHARTPSCFAGADRLPYLNAIRVRAWPWLPGPTTMLNGPGSAATSASAARIVGIPLGTAMSQLHRGRYHYCGPGITRSM